jgi:hypothetical protein
VQMSGKRLDYDSHGSIRTKTTRSRCRASAPHQAPHLITRVIGLGRRVLKVGHHAMDLAVQPPPRCLQADTTPLCRYHIYL